ncbi:MAG TPA: cation:proton antiporter [Candidatus Hydrogenedentes bacterium]|nr:cation:proton antiporter [Candidatus Hydrogenedentota bacterium]HPG69250.1 cation:proton antiporter [Candidatus Hydrogenedentota bacterium]
MHYLNEEHLLVFLGQVLVLLTVAKVLGELCQQRGIPALAGEIFTGILLGPTILGRVFPGIEARLFPHDIAQQTMLETVSWFGVLFLLLATGFEISISTVWKQGKAALTMGVVGIVAPFILGCVLFWWLPERHWGEASDRVTFTLFLATAASISAIPVIARILHDLEILKSDFGLTTLSAFIVNDVVGWLGFTMVLGLAHPHGAGASEVARILFEILLFGTVCMTVGSKVVGAINGKLQATNLPQPGTTLTFICCLGLMCGTITQWIGIHAILGFFLAGIMAGNAPEVSEKTRQTISQVIHAIFVPVFFATIGIKIDFLANVDFFLVLLVTAVAVGGKFIGGWIGARVAGLSKPDILSAAVARIPGGAMEIVLGILALELQLISDDVFVALVFAAIASSVAAGPLLAWSIRRRKRLDIGQLLSRDAVVLEMGSETRWDAIQELCRRVAAALPELDQKAIEKAVRAREEIMGTGLERGVAVPHARLKGLESPVVAFGRSRVGIDWDARDGLPTRFVFLILTPEDEQGIQVQILAAIARIMSGAEVPARLIAAQNEDEAFGLLNEALNLGGLVPNRAPA